jgi:hypothetical protein
MTRQTAHKYVTYSEVKELLKRLGEGSLLVVYQHIPPVQREPFFEMIAARLEQNAGCHRAICVTDNSVAFFILSHCDGPLDDAFRTLRQSPYGVEHSVMVRMLSDIRQGA